MYYVLLVSFILLVAIIWSLFNCHKISILYDQYKTGKSANIFLIALVAMGLLLSCIPILLTEFSLSPFSYLNTGEIGDIIGGTTAPFIGFIGIVLTFFAFWVQYQSNVNQRGDISIERFENQYYEMLRLHKENVKEMDIADQIKGRKCFVRMFYEYRHVYLSIYHVSQHPNVILEYNKNQLCDLAYKLFFHGIGEENDDTINDLFSKDDLPLITLTRHFLSKVQKDWGTNILIIGGIKTTTIENEEGNNNINFEMFYYPFDGHSTRLGHYYRHLFQTVSFIVDKQDLTYEEKYKYLKLLRAQLSDHEQTLLYYNGISSFGEEWITREYFSEYRMIKNISFLLANFGVKPVDKLGVINKRQERIFEWS